MPVVCPCHALREGSSRRALEEPPASRWRRRLDTVGISREQRGLGDQPFPRSRCSGGQAAAGWGALSASPAAESPGSRGRERGESGIHCTVVSNFLLLSRSSSAREQCPERLRLPRLGTRPALGEVAPRSQADTCRLMTSDSHLLRNLWGRWGLVAGSNPLLSFVIISLGLGGSPPDLICECSLKTFPLCPGRTVLPVPPGRQDHQRLGEQSGLSDPRDSLEALEMEPRGCSVPLSPQEEGERAGSLGTSSSSSSVEDPGAGMARPQNSSWGPKAQDHVQRKWGGVSSFLSVITLGLLLVDLSIFISLAGLLFHHQKTENPKIVTHMWKGAETAESCLTPIFRAVEKEALRMAGGNKRSEGTTQVFRGLQQGSAVLQMRRDQSRLAHT